MLTISTNYFQETQEKKKKKRKQNHPQQIFEKPHNPKTHN